MINKETLFSFKTFVIMSGSVIEIVTMIQKLDTKFKIFITCYMTLKLMDSIDLHNMNIFQIIFQDTLSNNRNYYNMK